MPFAEGVTTIGRKTSHIATPLVKLVKIRGSPEKERRRKINEDTIFEHGRKPKPRLRTSFFNGGLCDPSTFIITFNSNLMLLYLALAYDREYR